LANEEDIMPLGVAKVPLELAIFNALEKARTDYINPGDVDVEVSPAAINRQIAKDLAAAIHAYATAAVVVTSVNTAVVGAGPTGPVVGTGFGAGNGTLN
jgi:hypothetical protein